MDPSLKRRAELLAATDLSTLIDLAGSLLGPARACPGHHPAGPAPALEMIDGRPPRWRCTGCGDGGTAVDLVALAARCSAHEALVRLGAWQAEHERSTTRPPAPARTGRRLGPVAIVVRDGHGEREVEVLATTTATVGDLAQVITGEVGALAVDGVVVPASERLAASALREGSTVSRPGPSPAPGGEGGTPAAAELRWIGGFDAGRVDRLAPGTWLAGTTPTACLHRADAGACQAAIVDVGPEGALRVEPLRAGAAELDLAPVGASPGEAPPGATSSGPAPAVRGELRIGGGVALVSVASAAAPASGPGVPARPVLGRWTVPVVRRASVAGPDGPDLADPLQFDAEPGPEPRPPGGASAVPALASLAGGVVLAVVVHQPLLLILGGIGAAGSLGTWAWQRIRHRRASRRAQYQAALARRAAEADRAARRARQENQQRARHPDLTVVADRIAGTVPGLWAHRLAPRAAVPLAVGLAVPRADPDAGTVPLVTDLQPGAALAVTGHRDDAASVVRGMMLRLAADHGPADLAIRVVTADPAWAWSAWLPHVGGPHRHDDDAAGVGQLPVSLLVVSEPGPLPEPELRTTPSCS